MARRRKRRDLRLSSRALLTRYSQSRPWLPCPECQAVILRDRIEGDVWRSDETLPNEGLLASEFGVARNTVRDALLELENEGLIRREVGAEQSSISATLINSAMSWAACSNASPARARSIF